MVSAGIALMVLALLGTAMAIDSGSLRDTDEGGDPPGTERRRTRPEDSRV